MHSIPQAIDNEISHWDTEKPLCPFSGQATHTTQIIIHYEWALHIKNTKNITPLCESVSQECVLFLFIIYYSKDISPCMSKKFSDLAGCHYHIAAIKIFAAMSYFDQFLFGEHNFWPLGWP